jgi:hypothetical protein
VIRLGAIPVRRRSAFAAQPAVCIAAISLAAALSIWAWRPSPPARHTGQAIAAALGHVDWYSVPACLGVELAVGSSSPARATFWVGFISLASGVAIIQQADWLRVARMGGRCGH